MDGQTDKPKYAPFKCVVCNGFGTLKYGEKTCQACDGLGFITIDNETGLPVKKDRQNENTNSTY